MKQLSHQHPVWLCDIWGVVHNGVAPFANTVVTLAQHRKAGGCVVLVSNSPRSREGIITQLDEIGIARDAYDDAVTSGDVTQTLMRKVHGGKLFHIGPDRDLSLFKGLDVERVPADDARAVICTGLFRDDVETPDDYVALLKDLRTRNLPMICANPDKRVRKGNTLLWCAGALAEVYANLGGEVAMAGKPFDPIYELAELKASSILGRAISKTDVLAIGDGPETDILGAANRSYACVYVSGGVRGHVEDMTSELEEVRKSAPTANIVAAVPHLSWST
jgi:HAD superfamily hydrolase (TIGR01459 family)